MNRLLRIVVLISALAPLVVLGPRRAAAEDAGQWPTCSPLVQPGMFDIVLGRLSSVRPTPQPVIVLVQATPPDLMGFTSLDAAGHLMIVVNRDLPDMMQCEVLVHEWAHALLWGLEDPEHMDHGPHWGVAFADAYRAAMWGVR